MNLQIINKQPRVNLQLYSVFLYLCTNLAYHEAFFSLRISLVAHVARVLAFDALERRPLVSKPWIGSLSTSCSMPAPNAVHKSLKKNQRKKLYIQ